MVVAGTERLPEIVRRAHSSHGGPPCCGRCGSLPTPGGWPCRARRRRHDAGVTSDHGPEQRERPRGGVHPVARRDEVLDQQGDTVEPRGRSAVARRALAA